MSFIEVSKKQRITWVTINRPDKMNAITPEMHDDLQTAFDNFSADPEQFVCVITGAGEKAFSAGSDLTAGIHRDYPKNGYAGLIERFDLSKPVIAAVNGLALGGGFEIVLACDIVVASDTASFGLPEPLVGAVALGGGIHRLPRQIGLKNAMGLLLTSRRVDVQEAYRLGLVNEIVPAKTLEAAAQRWCEEILKGAPLSVRASKEAAMRGLEEDSLSAALKKQNDYPAYAQWRTSEDLKEGRAAFAEKRPPNWKGK